MAQVQKGIEFIATKKLVENLSWRYAEERCCGKVTVDPEYLKRFTSYKDHCALENSLIKQWFWEILQEMPQSDRSLYIRFVLGSKRLPVDLSALQY
jgi:hypothetical protein